MDNSKSFNYTIKDNKRKTMRILINIKGNLVPIFWFKIGNDGSLYCSLYGKNETIIKGGKTISQDGVISVNYDEGLQIPCDKLDNKRISFHKSGVIHGYKKKSLGFSTPFDEIYKSEYLCDVLFQDLIDLDTIKQSRKRDIVIPYNYRSGHALFGVLLISKEDIPTIPYMSGATAQTNIIYCLECLDGAEFIKVIFVLYDSINMWPSYNYIIYPLKRQRID